MSRWLNTIKNIIHGLSTSGVDKKNGFFVLKRIIWDLSTNPQPSTITSLYIL